ncbi:MAG: GntR family transcriptional regulator [Ruminococcaceae bacterium]|nr:GntR family transcriptional regulator [Oscillospiraceae bacterium]
MEWQMDKRRPICPQIEEQISAKIACGELLPGERLMSVREVAMGAGVNPNTVQKAFKMLEERGLIHSERSTGWFVSDRRTEAKRTVRALAEEKTALYLADMEMLALSREEIAGLIASYYEKKEMEEKAGKEGTTT